MTEEEKRKIYFACPILGATDKERARYEILMCLVREHGTILTGFFADREQIEKKEREMTDEEIFNRDIELLNEADAIVAEVSNKSHGVGIELGMMAGKKPILAIRKSEERLSPMIAGNKDIHVITQTSIKDLVNGIENFFEHLVPNKTI